MDRASSEVIVRQLRQLAEAEDLAEQPDSQLLQRFAASCDEAAFTTLLTRHGPMVLGVCRRVLTDRHATEDVFQATFLVLARKARSIRKSGSVASWLYGVAYRLAVRVKSRAAQRRQRERQTPERPVAGPDDEVSDREIEAILDEELSGLPECYRTGLVLCYLQGKTREQAASQLGLPLRTLQRHLERGRKLLHARLSRRGLFLAGLSAAVVGPPLRAAEVPVALAHATVAAAVGGRWTGEAAALAEVGLRSIRLAAGRRCAMLVLAVALAVAAGGWAAQALGWTKPRADPPPMPMLAGVARAQLDDLLELIEPHVQEQPPLLRHDGPVNCVAYSPDGNTIASGSERDAPALRIWDTATGRALFESDPPCAVLALAIARTGTLAAGCDDKTIRLFNTKTGKALTVLRGHDDPAAGKEHYFQPGAYRGVSSVLFTDDGKTLISGGYDGTVRLWDVAAGKEVGRFTLAGHKVHRLALSSDGKTLAAGCEELDAAGHHPIRLWDLATRRPIRPDLPRFRGMYANGPVTALAFAPDGQRLAVGGFDSEVMLWDVTTGQALASCRGGVLMVVQSLAFNAAGDRLAAGCSDGRIHWWDGATAQLLRQHAGHAGAHPARLGGVSAVAFSPDGRMLASGGCDHRVRLWEAATGKERAFGE